MLLEHQPQTVALSGTEPKFQKVALPEADLIKDVADDSIFPVLRKQGILVPVDTVKLAGTDSGPVRNILSLPIPMDLFYPNPRRDCEMDNPPAKPLEKVSLDKSFPGRKKQRDWIPEEQQPRDILGVDC